MSEYLCIASNDELIEIKNDKIEYLTVNQAKSRELVLPDFILENETIDQDKDLVILSCNCEEDFYEIAITPERTRCFGNEYSEKMYISQITGKITRERAEFIHDYLIKSLIVTDEIEVWQLWEGEILEPKIFEAKSSNNLKELLVHYLVSSGVETPVCIKAKNGILSDTTFV